MDDFLSYTQRRFINYFCQILFQAAPLPRVDALLLQQTSSLGAGAGEEDMLLIFLAVTTNSGI